MKNKINVHLYNFNIVDNRHYVLRKLKIKVLFKNILVICKNNSNDHNLEDLFV